MHNNRGVDSEPLIRVPQSSRGPQSFLRHFRDDPGETVHGRRPSDERRSHSRHKRDTVAKNRVAAGWGIALGIVCIAVMVVVFSIYLPKLNHTSDTLEEAVISIANLQDRVDDLEISVITLGPPTKHTNRDVAHQKTRAVTPPASLPLPPGYTVYHTVTELYKDGEPLALSHLADVDLTTTPPEAGNTLGYNENGTWVPMNNVYGTQFHQASSEPESTTMGPTFVQKLRLTTASLPSGAYMISWYYEWRYSSAGNNFLAQIQINDTTTIMEHVQEPKDPNASQSQPASGFYYASNLSGIQNIDLDFAGSSGPPTAGIKRARLQIYRVS